MTEKTVGVCMYLELFRRRDKARELNQKFVLCIHSIPHTL
jgi:hypothetical protein